MGFPPTQSLIVIKKVPVFKDVSVMYPRTYDMKKGKKLQKSPISSVENEPGRNAGLYFFLFWDIFFLP